MGLMVNPSWRLFGNCDGAWWRAGTLGPGSGVSYTHGTEAAGRGWDAPRPTLPEAAKAAILSENARRFFNLARLSPAAVEGDAAAAAAR
jgi:hypothetical protein